MAALASELAAVQLLAEARGTNQMQHSGSHHVNKQHLALLPHCRQRASHPDHLTQPNQPSPHTW